MAYREAKPSSVLEIRIKEGFAAEFMRRGCNGHLAEERQQCNERDFCCELYATSLLHVYRESAPSQASIE